jgi:hypothetical protein
MIFIARRRALAKYVPGEQMKICLQINDQADD